MENIQNEINATEIEVLPMSIEEVEKLKTKIENLFKKFSQVVDKNKKLKSQTPHERGPPQTEQVSENLVMRAKELKYENMELQDKLAKLKNIEKMSKSFNYHKSLNFHLKMKLKLMSP